MTYHIYIFLYLKWSIKIIIIVIMEVKIIKKNRNGNSATAVINCNGSTYNKFMVARKINIGFEKCRVFENIYLVRCFKCFGFNHKMEECKQVETVAYATMHT